MGFMVLYDHPISREQILTFLGEGGGVSSDCVVHWDERVDGPFPDAQLPNVGSLVRQGGALVIDAAKLADFNSKQAAKAAKETAKAARRARLATHNPAAANSVPELRVIVQDLLAEVRGD